jgi:hypothetical protein
MDEAEFRRSAIARRNKALQNADVIFKRFEIGQANEDELLPAFVDLLRAQTLCNRLLLNRHMETMEGAAKTPFDPIDRWNLAAAGTSLLIESCDEGMERRRGKIGKGPHVITAARSLISRLQSVYERATESKATISTASQRSRCDAERLSGPYPEFLRRADLFFRKIAADTGARWPAGLPDLAKEMRRKARPGPKR